jgi:sortase (surface protein transpeptidase)
VARRGNRFTTAIFGLLLLLGMTGVGFARIQIYQLRTSAGNQVLPALAPLVPSETPQAIKTPVTRLVVYSPYPKIGDVIGTISLPSLKQNLPIIEGTDEAEFKRGVGHRAINLGSADLEYLLSI